MVCRFKARKKAQKIKRIKNLDRFIYEWKGQIEIRERCIWLKLLNIVCLSIYMYVLFGFTK